MTNHEIEEFFKDNFGKEYHPVLHGKCASIAPLTLIVEKKKKWYNRGKNLVAMANLSKYVTDKELFGRLVKDRMKKIEKKLEQDEVDRLERRVNCEEFNIEVSNVVKVDYVTKNLTGDLVLGPLDEEYFEDPDLREILKTPLDKEMMKPYLDAQKIYIVTSVVYSEKYKIRGKPHHFDQINFQLNAGKFAKFLGAAANLKGKHERKIYMTPWIEREGRGPLLFAYSKVIYQESEGRLHLSDFVGKNITTRVPQAVKRGIYETVVDEGQHELEELLSVSPLEEKLEAVQNFLFTIDAHKRKQMLKTYLKYMEELLDKGTSFCFLDDKPTEKQVAYLETFGFQVDDIFLKVKEKEVCLEYGNVFNYLNGLSEEKLEEFQQCKDEKDSVDKKKEKTEES